MCAVILNVKLNTTADGTRVLPNFFFTASASFWLRSLKLLRVSNVYFVELMVTFSGQSWANKFQGSSDNSGPVQSYSN